MLHWFIIYDKINLILMYETMPKIEYFKTELKFTDALFLVFPGGRYSVHADYEETGYPENDEISKADFNKRYPLCFCIARQGGRCG